jgi:Complex 1 protein (LYR family)
MVSLRNKVIDLYKNLLFISKTYPDSKFKARLHQSFMKKKDLKDPKEIQKAIEHGWFVYREIEALWFLKKYRAMKRRYTDREEDDYVNLEKKLKEIEKKL